MIHNPVSDNPNGGHWAVNYSSDRVHLLVQIGEINEARQVRLKLTAPVALRLAADIITAAQYNGQARNVCIGDEDEAWELWRSTGDFTLTLRDPIGVADHEARLAMSQKALHAMATGILDKVTKMLETTN